MNRKFLENFIKSAISEDIGDGDHTSMACIPNHVTGKAKLLVKQKGIIAGVDISKYVYELFDQDLNLDYCLQDGSEIEVGDVVFYLQGNVHSILRSERLVLNIMQRMSGIATETNRYVEQLKGTNAKILDTRKTTPGFRYFEKEAVRLGGGKNHRMGLYDMIMIKDNHIDFAGGIKEAIQNTNDYLTNNSKQLKIEIEARSIEEVNTICEIGNVDRIMLDNFSIEDTITAVKLIDGRYETESSGGITIKTIKDYAECGVDYISVGALTHQIRSLDLSLKAID